ncbi:unnamed protein product [Mytilus edulis]|uniref:Uncharacterized protein n=1 Tax=Mytilus edulis TaxID=6550 RepID=A0A8S3UZD1_MYTED|nr:unnamed protein product [Mytilus edulis]
MYIDIEIATIDSRASHIKACVRRYINEGHDVTSAKEMKQLGDPLYYTRLRIAKQNLGFIMTELNFAKTENFQSGLKGGITVTPTFSKVIETILKMRENCKIILCQNPLQRGFTENSSQLLCELIVEEFERENTDLKRPTCIYRALRCKMETGLHRENGLDPETSIAMLRTYILPILTYGLEIVLPKGKMLDNLQLKTKKLLKQILSLNINVADPAYEIHFDIKVGKIHPLALANSANQRDINRITIGTKIATGTCILQTNRAAYNQNNVDPTCKLCDQAEETLSHYFSVL